MLPLSGLYAASLTPLHEVFRCHVEELAKHCQDLMKRGCAGVVLVGTTGEGTLFNVEERKQVLEKVIKMGLDPARVILGVSCNAVQDAVDLSLAAIRSSCGAVLMAPPFFYKNLSEQG